MSECALLLWIVVCIHSGTFMWPVFKCTLNIKLRQYAFRAFNSVVFGVGTSMWHVKNWIMDC